MLPRITNPEWATLCFDLIVPDDDPKRVDALIHLIAGLAPSEEENRQKSEVAWALIEYGFRKLPECGIAARKHLGVPV